MVRRRARAAGDVAWQDAVVGWMAARDLRGFFYWALNASAGGTGGVLQGRLAHANARKLALLGASCSEEVSPG